MSEPATMITIVGTGVAITVSFLAILANSLHSRMSALGNQIDTLRGDMRKDHEGLSSQIDTLRGDMRKDHEALRGDMRKDHEGLSRQIDTLRGDVRKDYEGLDTRVRSVQIEFAKVDQRLGTLERVVIPQAPSTA